MSNVPLAVAELPVLQAAAEVARDLEAAGAAVLSLVSDMGDAVRAIVAAVVPDPAVELGATLASRFVSEA